jgi:hypothetical protein
MDRMARERRAIVPEETGEPVSLREFMVDSSMDSVFGGMRGARPWRIT